ncbi:hypothetical protein HRbin40_00102 [bacterium HR40]|nr:hypothetical protein HRbin40_00102 [bacterium HR40]
MQALELATFGARLRALRRARGLSQVQLARAIGRHHSVIGPYERDEFLPARPVLERLAAVLGTSPEYLLFGRSPQRGHLPQLGSLGPAGVLRTGHHEVALLGLRHEALMLVAIEDDSMAPVHRPGGFAVVEAAPQAVHEELFGREALAELADGRVVLRRLFPSASTGRYDLVAWNAPPLQAVEVRSVRPVVGFLHRQAFAA